MTGQIMERPLPDGTAMIHVTLHYDNLPFRVYPLDNILSACDDASQTCDTSKYTPIVVDGRMSVKMTWDFAILTAGGPLSLDNIDWSKTGQNSTTGQGVGTFTGDGGFQAGKHAVVKLTSVWYSWSGGGEPALGWLSRRKHKDHCPEIGPELAFPAACSGSES